MFRERERQEDNWVSEYKISSGICKKHEAWLISMEKERKKSTILTGD